METNLILKFKLQRGGASQFRWAHRIKFDGNGGLIIFTQEKVSSERLLLSRVHDLRIQPLPAFTYGLECRA
jgi:hypothetical protein